MEENKPESPKGPLPPTQGPVYVTKNDKGNSDTITRSYYDSLVFRQRLIGSAIPSLRTTLFGRELESPIMIAPMGFPGGKFNTGLCLAGAAKRIGTILWAGMVGPDLVETGVPLIEITKPVSDVGAFYDRIAKAKAKGVVAVGTDIDHAFGLDGNYDVSRNGEVTMRSMDLDELKRAVETAGDTPFIMKGILSAEDALACREAGVAAIVLSHHHGIFPFAVPPVRVLPEIRAAVGPDMLIFVDCGVRDGYDAMKALALGADGVLVARALIKSLNTEGEEGVYQYLKEMNDQLRGIMARCGVMDMKQMTPDVIVQL